MLASAFGMSSFFLSGPVPILPNDSPINGLVSLPFVTMLLLNTMFGVRVVCIENAFFSSYRYHYYTEDRRGIIEKSIDPIISPQLRILTYFAPSAISFTINIVRLLCTKVSPKIYVKKYPQILMASCFTPFIFEGTKNNSIRIWKTGSVLNAFFIGCLPQIILLTMDFYRGVVNWDFLGLALRPEQIIESNDALLKYRYGNTLFAIISGSFFLFLIIITFFTNKIFKNHGMYCTSFSVLCFPCSNTFLTLDNEKSPPLSLQNNTNLSNDESDSVLDIKDTNENKEDPKEGSSKMYVYSIGKGGYFKGEPSSKETIELNKIKKVTTLRIYIRDRK